MRDELGQSNDEHQNQRAQSYRGALQSAEADARLHGDRKASGEERQSALVRLRETAERIETGAESDYDNDRIIGADYESIMKQLAIMFVGVPAKYHRSSGVA